MNLIIDNQEIFQTNSSIHNTTTRNKRHLHRPNINLSCFQNSTIYAVIKIFNILPPSVTILENDMAKLKSDLRKYLNTKSFYSVNELFICKDDVQYYCIKYL
jgi:hypothetical protein